MPTGSRVYRTRREQNSRKPTGRPNDMDTLPVPAIEALRDYVPDRAKDQAGAAADFLRALGTYLQES
jgi:hypothetical protein